jgi:hypothetical protein
MGLTTKEIPMKSIDDKPIDFDDFHQRWVSARVAAIHKVLPSKSAEESDLVDQYYSTFSDASPEDKAKKRDALLKNIFDHSRLLALSFSKFKGLTFEIEDFKDLLQNSQIPCFQGKWGSRENAKVLTRNGCNFCPKSGAFACDYWREALDGLVMGLGEKERLARHASIRHGDKECVDVFFTEEKNQLAFGPLPDHMAKNLSDICLEFENKMKSTVLVKGLSEGILYFEFKSSTDEHCGGTNLLTYTFQRKIQKVFPGLLVKEISPRAVLGVES